MESPVRKMQKRNDYNRHKLLRKIKRRRKAEAEQQSHAAEKELRRKMKMPKFAEGKNILPELTVTGKRKNQVRLPSLDELLFEQLDPYKQLDDYVKRSMNPYGDIPQFDDGKSSFLRYELNDPNQARLNGETGDWQVLDQNGNPVVNNGGYMLPDLVVRGLNIKKANDEAELQRAFLQSEIWNGKPYPGHGSLETVSPEFDAITIAPLLKMATRYGASKLLNLAQKLHIGNYYLKPQYNNLSYIRQVGDDAVEDMMRTGQMRTSEAIFDELYQKLVDEIGEEAAEKIAFSDVFDVNANTVYNGFDFSPKTFNRNMFYTGKPFYGPVRTNYIITKPRPITKQKDLVKKGLEWIEDGHKGHTGTAKAAARNAGLDPNTAPGRIVDPVYNGDTNIIPMSEFGPFELYRPVSAYGFKLPFYRRTSFK